MLYTVTFDKTFVAGTLLEGITVPDSSLRVSDPSRWLNAEASGDVIKGALGSPDYRITRVRITPLN